MRLLIVEDSEELAQLLANGLKSAGYDSDVLLTASDARAALSTTRYAAVILDLGLPDGDGLSILREIRQRNDPTPVLVLTARGSVDDRVGGLHSGADDYLVKPFAFSELLARVRSLLRRGPPRQVELLRVGDLEVDLIRHKAMRNGKSLDLTRKEFALLSLFVRRTSEVLSRTLIAEQVWDMNFDSDTNVVDVAVRRLRRKVDDPFPVKLIHTVRGVGYVLEKP